MSARDPFPLYAQATARAEQTLARLGVLSEEDARRRRIAGRVELFLWKFLRMRWYDAHRFFDSVESIEAQELIAERYEPGMVFHFFSARQNDTEWENCMTVGMSLLFAAIRQAQGRGFDPKSVGIFTLQRMLEQALEAVDGLDDLLRVGARP